MVITFKVTQQNNSVTAHSSAFLLQMRLFVSYFTAKGMRCNWELEVMVPPPLTRGSMPLRSPLSVGTWFEVAG